MKSTDVKIIDWEYYDLWFVKGRSLGEDSVYEEVLLLMPSIYTDLKDVETQARLYFEKQDDIKRDQWQIVEMTRKEEDYVVNVQEKVKA